MQFNSKLQFWTNLSWGSVAKVKKAACFLPKLDCCAAAQRGKRPGVSHPEPLPYVRVQKWPDQKLKGPASLDGVGQIIVIWPRRGYLFHSKYRQRSNPLSPLCNRSTGIWSPLKKQFSVKWACNSLQFWSFKYEIPIMVCSYQLDFSEQTKIVRLCNSACNII